MFLTVCLTTPPSFQTTCHLSHPVLRVPQLCDGQVFTSASFSVSCLGDTMPLQLALTSHLSRVAETTWAKRRSKVIWGDPGDCAHTECADKNSLHLFSTLKSFHRQSQVNPYIWPIFTGPMKILRFGKVKRPQWVLLPLLLFAQGVSSNHPILARRHFIFKLGKNMDKSEVWNWQGVSENLEFKHYNIKISHVDHTPFM